MQRKYNIPDYNKHLSLKVGRGLGLVFLYLLRPYLILIASVVNRRDTMGLVNMIYEDKLPMSLSAAAAFPAMFVIYAWMKRAPGASDFVKSIWSKGRLLLVCSAVLNCIVVFVPIYTGIVNKMSDMAWIQLGLSALIILYIVFSGRVKDTFADFPEEE